MPLSTVLQQTDVYGCGVRFLSTRRVPCRATTGATGAARPDRCLSRTSTPRSGRGMPKGECERWRCSRGDIQTVGWPSGWRPGRVPSRRPRSPCRNPHRGRTRFASGLRGERRSAGLGVLMGAVERKDQETGTTLWTSPWPGSWFPDPRIGMGQDNAPASAGEGFVAPAAYGQLERVRRVR